MALASTGDRAAKNGKNSHKRKKPAWPSKKECDTRGFLLCFFLTLVPTRARLDSRYHDRAVDRQKENLYISSTQTYIEVSRMINSVQGGRGKRSPYNKTTVSVPTDIVPLIKRICNLYRNYAIEFGLDFAKKQVGGLDAQTDAIAKNQADTPISLQEFELQEILKLVQTGASGYKKNSASQLIARLKNLATMQ